MTKIEFICTLSQKLTALPKDELTKTLEYYDEMINDRIEDGMNEEEAIAALGDIDKIAEEILCSQPMGTLVRSKIHKERAKGTHSTAWLALAIIGSPIWLSLLAAAAIILLSIYIVILAVVLSAGIMLAAFALTAVVGLVYAPFAFGTSASYGLMVLSAAFICGALGLVMLPASVYCCKGAAWLTKAVARAVKRLFVQGGRLV